MRRLSKSSEIRFLLHFPLLNAYYKGETIFHGRRGRVSFRRSINKSAVVSQNDWSSCRNFRSTPNLIYLCQIFVIWRENQTSEIKVFKIFQATIINSSMDEVKEKEVAFLPGNFYNVRFSKNYCFAVHKGDEESLSWYVSTMVQWSRSCLNVQINRVRLPSTLFSVSLYRFWPLFFNTIFLFGLFSLFLLLTLLVMNLDQSEIKTP